MLNKHSFVSHNIAPKHIWLIFAVLIMVFFGDSIFLFIGHLIHVMLEFMASILEHGLQIAFNLSERQAHIALFYIVLVTGSFIVWRLAKTIYRKGQAFCQQVSCRLRQATHEVN